MSATLAATSSKFLTTRAHLKLSTHRMQIPSNFYQPSRELWVWSQKILKNHNLEIEFSVDFD